MPVGSYVRALEFAVRSGVREARLLGGEPTLHPELPVLVDEALHRGLDVLIFSNGRMPESAVRSVESAPAGRIRVLIHATAGGAAAAFPDPAVRTVLERLGGRVSLGMTVSSPAFEYRTIFRAFDEFRLKRSLRVGLAHPDPAGANAFLRPRRYEETGRRVAELAESAEAGGIALEFDCGFVPCMFPEDLRERAEGIPDLGRRCSPILDVLPDLSVIPCFPLAGVWRSGRGLIEGAGAEDLRRRAGERLEPFRNVTLFPECRRCPLREDGRCGGGCLAAALRRARFVPFEISAPVTAGRDGKPVAFRFKQRGGSKREAKKVHPGRPGRSSGPRSSGPSRRRSVGGGAGRLQDGEAQPGPARQPAQIHAEGRGSRRRRGRGKAGHRMQKLGL
jgi:MoaA/NifB/PqqE/SkfB family radical SAM enzyme